MSSRGGYPIEEFLEAITAQLDQTQDALRLKAVNRPLTFALKDFNADLKVFVEMDAEGRVIFRPAAPNEEGASTVNIGFTTITRPMIEENTISMEMAQAPTLDELGLQADERRQLAKIGVRNAAQLRNLEQNAGTDTLSRHTGVDLGRIRGALNLAQPRLDDVVAEAPRGNAPEPTPSPITEPPAAEPGPSSPGPSSPEPHGPTLWPPREPPQRYEPRPPESAHPRVTPAQEPPTPVPGKQPMQPEFVRPGIAQPAPGLRGNLADRLRRGLGDINHAEPPPRQPRRLRLAPGTRNIRLEGRNLVEQGRTPTARLDGRPLRLVEANPHAVSFALPPTASSGRLSVELPDGAVEEFDVTQEPRDAP